MKEHVVLTALGKDRVGIVDDITNGILESQCNLEESHMAVLGGEFAAILLASGEPETIARLIREMPALGENLDLRIELKSTSPPVRDTSARPYILESVSLDTQGIAHSITSLLKKYEINIEDLETETTSAPWTGAPMFTMKARVNIPSSIPLVRLRDEIDELASEQDLDIKLSPAP
ncbi:MAG: amino acid-binding protein [Spirochaetales bacterium]|jgi:glycine cleavage system transcriptional repressor|nr:amino acid-binding protein [Spirochaetales bacterium]